MIRRYKEEDLLHCIDIIEKVWRFDDKYKPESLSRLIKDYYLGSSLSLSNYAIIITENNSIRGFLFGNSGSERNLKSPYGGVSGSFRFFINLLFLRKVSLLKKLKILYHGFLHEVRRSRIEPSRKNELILFAVDPASQGKGYGKKLINSFIEYCKDNNASRIILETDEECNYGFYKHLGFIETGRFYSPLQKDFSGKSGDVFVYEMKMKDSYNHRE